MTPRWIPPVILMTPPPLAYGTHARLQWVRRGTPAITLTEALDTAIPVDVLDTTVVAAEAYYHRETDTLIVVQDQTVQTVLHRNHAPLRCPHDHPPTDCPTCSQPDSSSETNPFENNARAAMTTPGDDRPPSFSDGSIFR